MKLLKMEGQIKKAKFGCKVNTVDELETHWSQFENDYEGYKLLN